MTRSTFIPCRDCGRHVAPHRDASVDAERCAVCTLSAEGDALGLCRLAAAGSDWARVTLYDSFGINDEDRAAMLAVAGRV